MNDAVSLPLGIIDSETFRSASVRLEQGDAILLYTDGIIEACNEGGVIVDLERLAGIMKAGNACPSEIMNCIRAAVDAGLNGKAAADDQTMVAVTVP